jgi:Tfp pilus assembly protein PilV
MTSPRRREGGFTVIEILIAVAVMMIGLAGIMVIQSAVARGNRDSRRLDRAKMIAQQDMEWTRGLTVTQIQGKPANLGDQTTSDGVTFHRTLQIAQVPGQTNLWLVTVQVTYAEDGDESDLHVARVQMIRTQERL